MEHARRVPRCDLCPRAPRVVLGPSLSLLCTFRLRGGDDEPSKSGRLEKGTYVGLQPGVCGESPLQPSPWAGCRMSDKQDGEQVGRPAPG